MESSFGDEPGPSPAHTVPLHLDYYSVQRPFSDPGREMDEGVQSSCRDRVKGEFKGSLPSSKDGDVSMYQNFKMHVDSDLAV